MIIDPISLHHCTRAEYYEVDALMTRIGKIKALRDAKIGEKETNVLSCDFVNENWWDKLIES